MPATYRCPDDKRQLCYGLVTLRHLSHSAGILIRLLRMRKSNTMTNSVSFNECLF